MNINNPPNMPPCNISSPIMGGLINSGTITVPPGLNGVNGTVLVTNASNAAWTNTMQHHGEIHIKGDAVIEGTLTVDGKEITKDIDDRLSAIEERLCILRVDESLADRWAELGELRKRYRELEQECWEKDEIIRLLKGKS